MRWVLITNPAAGAGRSQSQLRDALVKLRAAGLRFELFESERPGQVQELARQAYLDGARAFIAAGGDGTVFALLNGLLPVAKQRPTLAVLPLGTGNCFAADCGVPTLPDALRALTCGQRRPVDVLHLEHAEGELYFANLLSVGFSARVGALTNRHLKPLGVLGYSLAVLLCVASHRHEAFALRGEDGCLDARPCTLLSFSNSRLTGGNMLMAPYARLDDGLLDLIRVGPLARHQLLAAFPRIFRGTHVELPETEYYQRKRIELACKRPVDVMVDGEVLQLTLRSLQVLPGAIEVLGWPS
ncbi:MAG: diacylglycerol kinase family lipid kinase [Myxococcota bacterium]|jgi:YegS/Rv2252/BmrU family lipid kinase|nr:diacylglycerol kinase family lipid kinase [Myxococcota bacterium]